MIDRFQTLGDAVWRALRLIAEESTQVKLGWLVLGTVLYFVSQAVRTRAWFNILRAAQPDAPALRARDVTAAYFAGAGLNGVVPARGGDLVKLYLVHRRAPRAPYSTLAATFVPETLFETAFGTGLVVWALAQGFLPVPVPTHELPGLDVSFVLAHPVVSAIAVGLGAAATVLVVRWVRRRATAFVRRVHQGFAILARPRDFVVGVVTWQVLARALRLVALACSLAAFALPVSVSTAVLVMAAQGGGRIVPLAPVSTGLRLAMLSYGFVEVTGHAVDIAAITAFTFGLGVLHLAVGLVISAVVLVATLGTPDPRRAIAAARRARDARREGGGDGVTAGSAG